MTHPTPPQPDAAHPFAGFGKFVPGFDFLQNLTAQSAMGATGSPSAAQPLPGLGGWIAPTLNVEELERRIKELKTVQFWLDQNATALKATITALEVQKMTLSTLKDMNFSMNELAHAFKVPGAAEVAAPAPPDKGKTFTGLEIPPTVFGAAPQDAPPASIADTPTAPEGKAATAAGADPMQWWGALTQQFQTIAAQAMKDVAQKAAATPLSPVSPPEGASSRAADPLATLAEQAAAAMAASREALAENTRKTLAGGAALMGKTLTQAAWPMPGPAAPKKAARAPTVKPAPASAKKPASKRSATAVSTKAGSAKTRGVAAKKAVAPPTARARVKSAAKPLAKSSAKR